MARVLAGLAIAACLSGVAPASAQSSAQSCGGQQTQSDMNECAGRAYTQADAALNGAYRQVAARLKSVPDSAKALVAAQKAWLAYRDAECGFETAMSEGGSIRPFLQAQCLEGLTRARTASFQAWLRCAEGDLSCPVPPP